MSPSSAIQEAVRAAIARLGRGLYGVACSGGADSIALADAAIEVAGASDVVLFVIDHGLRGGSETVAAEVAAWGRGRGASAVVRRVDVPPADSIERAARDARYHALAELADELGTCAVLVGHTARDQAETVLMRILRGTGPAGLAGIPEQRTLVAGVPIVRPLLAHDRAAIASYVAARELPVWDDPMNVDHAITRVRVREHLLPVLRRENPAIDTALCRLATSATEWLEVIDALAAPHARFPIDCALLASQPPAVRKRALALALEQAGATYDASHLEAIDALVTDVSRGQRALDLPGGRFVKTYDRAEFEPADRPAPRAAPTPNGVPVGYAIRTWRPGDRMRPQRLRGRSRKLSDLFVDAKVPRDRRVAARVIARQTDGVIVWAEYLGIAHESVVNGPDRDDILSRVSNANPPRTDGSF